MSNQLVNFFVELIKRFGGSTPKFFKIISFIGGVAAFVGFLPDIFVLIGIDVPLKWSKGLEIALKVAGLITAIGAQLPNQGGIAAVTNTGHPLKATNDNQLPFTANLEKKKAAKNDEIPVVTNVSTNPEKIQ